MHALGVDHLLSREQVISFFFEFAQAYVSARFFADHVLPQALAEAETVGAGASALANWDDAAF